MAASATTMGELYVKAMEATGRFVSAVRPDQWHVPTPDTEWDMHTLANHVTSENFWAAELFQGKTIAEVGNRLDGDLLKDDPIGAYSRSVEAARAQVLKPGAMEITTHLSFGDFPGSEYAKQLFLDLLVHGWDVAKAGGQDTRLDPALVERCIPIAEEMTAMVGDGGPYGTRRQFAPAASPQDRLLAIMGRSEDWRAP